MEQGVSADVLSLASPRHGHFRLESGHHSNLWLDLLLHGARDAGGRRGVVPVGAGRMPVVRVRRLARGSL